MAARAAPVEEGPLAPLFDLYPLLKHVPHFHPLLVPPPSAFPGIPRMPEDAAAELEKRQRGLVEELLENARSSARGKGPRRIRPATDDEKKRFEEMTIRNPLKLQSELNLLSTGLPEAKVAHLRRLGSAVGKDVVLTYWNTIDPLFPEKITIGDRSILGMGGCILTHEVVDGELFVGDVRIGREALVSFGTILLPGTSVGDRATVTPGVLASDLDRETVARGLTGTRRAPRGARPPATRRRKVEELPYDLTRWWRMLLERRGREEDPLWRPLRFGFNNLWLALQRLETTDHETRNRLLRMAGVQVGRGARIEPDVYFDAFFPERISIGDGAVVRRRCVLLAHEGLVGRLRIGDVVVGRRAVLEPGTCLVPGTVVGDGAHLYPYSFVTRSVPKGAVVDPDGIRASSKSSKR